MLGRGVFEELVDQAGPGIAAAHSSRGYAFGDFDNDGDLDILVVNLNEPPSRWRSSRSIGLTPAEFEFLCRAGVLRPADAFWPASGLKQQLNSIAANQLVTV